MYNPAFFWREFSMNDQHNQKLQQVISHKIAEKGGIAFADFMADCLYHPEWGYYMTDRIRVGKQGDFFTSSSVHSLFGVLISRQIRQMWELLGKEAFTIVEQGAGDGHLANDILNALQAEAPDFYQDLRYCIIEISPDNRNRQKMTLAAHGDRIAWSTSEALEPFTGCFLSN